jgi:NADH-quinone oxidoreductase subunit H
MFFGGWAAPFGFLPSTGVWPFLWLFGKMFLIVTIFLWLRASFPRYRYDQIMRLGWKVFIPITIVWLVLIGAWMQTPWNIWK